MPTLADALTAATAAVNANAQEYFDREERVALREAGAVAAANLVPNASDPTELAQSASLGTRLIAAGGSVNALKVSLPASVQWPALLQDMEFLLPTIGANTGPVTVQLGGFTVPPASAAGSGLPAGTLQLLTRSGAQLAKGDLTGIAIRVRADGAGSLRIVGYVFSDIAALTPVFPPVNATIYVRPDGSDTNDGSSNTALTALKTIAAAIAMAGRYATTGVAIKIALGIPGTYASPGIVNRPAGNFAIVGDPAAQDQYIIQGGASANGFPMLTAYGCTLAVQGVTLANTGTTSDTLGSTSYGFITVSNTTFTCVAGNPNYHISSTAQVAIGNGCIIASSMGGWCKAITGNVTFGSGITITFANAPNWSVVGVFADTLGTFTFAGATPSFPGAVTGTRFNISTNSAARINGAGLSLFPGSVAGSTYNGGQYV